ncbi:MAG: UDP-N-acetylglucosamine 3-dehydrogenase [Solirubrobacterales bacterium]|jgi:predicted dehydrogenase|nr:UDP-N-acetylglucosamine 3-dehydrogenase [Solirubrobacterales bacterium]
MSAERKIHRGVIAGLGQMGGHHLRVLGALPDVEVVGVIDPDAERRAAAIAERPSIGAFESLAEALEQTEPDFTCIAAPAPLLAELAGASIAAGVPVFVEKPMAATSAEATSLLRQAEAGGVLLAVGYVERFNPAVRALKQKLDEGMLGQIYQLHARRLSPFPGRTKMLGVAFDLATHDIDLMRYLTGSEVERVFAETSRRLTDDGEDLLCATLRLGADVTGLLEVNWMTPAKIRQLSVTGEKGMFVVDYLTQDLYFYEHPRATTDWAALAEMRGGGEGDMIRYAIERREPLRVQWEEFLSALESGEAPAVGGGEGLAALLTAEAVQRSGERHEVEVPERSTAALS